MKRKAKKRKSYKLHEFILAFQFFLDLSDSYGEVLETLKYCSEKKYYE